MPRAAATMLAASLAGVLLAGCAGWVTERIVAPPRSPAQLAWTKRTLERAEVPFERLKRRKAPDIAYAVFEPGDYALRYRTFSFSNDTWSALVDWHAPTARQPARNGTVVLVHGWSMDAGMMLPWAVAFAERGFRAVVVELRGHGRSQAGRMGYGKREADDVLAVVAHLRRKHRVAEPLHLFGISYGAVTVLHAAARMAVAAGGEPAEDVARGAGDDAREAAARAARPAPPVAVVAVEPFANAADAIRSMHQFATTSLRGGWRHWLVRNSARMLVGEATMETAITNASRRLELDLAELDTSVALSAAGARSHRHGHPPPEFAHAGRRASRGTAGGTAPGRPLQHRRAYRPAGRSGRQLVRRAGRAGRLRGVRGAGQHAARLRRLRERPGACAPAPAAARARRRRQRARARVISTTPARMMPIATAPSAVTCSPSSSTPSSTAMGGLT
jgi:pimeloyl-ACP methyl ester carboxylesterase